VKIARSRVLVTGAGGFIGSHLTEALVRAGAGVRALIRYNSRNHHGHLEGLSREILREVEVVAGDLRDLHSVRQAVHGCDAVFHLGALIAVPYSFTNVTEYVQTNVLGTAHVVLAALEAGVRRIVHTSTSEVYGSARYSPIDERHPLCAQSPYAASKIGADKIAESLRHASAAPVVTVRPFNTYGPRQSARAVIPTILSQAIAGKTVRVGSLTPKRDFLFVEDTARGFIRAAECDRALGETLNLGTGKAVSIAEVLRAVEKILGLRLRVVQERRRIRPNTSEVKLLCADARRARRILDWRPQVRFAEGLRRTVAWYREQGAA
jgi:dTDP-glucose 4,6-dehydratase